MSERLSTGISLLDDELGGGVHEGSLVTFEAQPKSQSHLLINHFIEPYPTKYITTQRTPESIKEGFERANISDSNIEIAQVEKENIVSEVIDILENLEEKEILIIDRVDEFEHTDGHLEILRKIQTKMLETGGICYLYRSSTLDGQSERTKNMSDFIFSLETFIDGTDIINHLAVNKSRGTVSVDEVIKLNLRDEVRVDTSRDIA